MFQVPDVIVDNILIFPVLISVERENGDVLPPRSGVDISVYDVVTLLCTLIIVPDLNELPLSIT